VLDLRTSVGPLSHILDVSGPDVAGVPVGDTFSAMHALVQAAAREVIVAGYSIYNGKTLFKPLAERNFRTRWLWFDSKSPDNNSGFKSANRSLSLLAFPADVFGERKGWLWSEQIFRNLP
jgi:hypothetical protein